MIETALPTTAQGWQGLIEIIANERCDLDVLLKDEWRHKVTVRDTPPTAGPTNEQVLVIDPECYATLKILLLNNNRTSLAAFLLTVFHGVLGAYGHGSRTVIAFVNAVASGSLQASRLLPTIVDHPHWSEFTCIEAVEAIDGALQQEDAYTEPAELLQRNLFDAVLVLADNDNPLADMPSFPLAAVVCDNEGAGYLQWTVTYAADLFEDKVIAGFLEVMRELLKKIACRPTQRLKDLEFISEQQKQQLDGWNATDGDFPTEMRLEELFEDAVSRTPDSEAVVSGNTRINYRELNRLSNRLARVLLRNPVHHPQIVALYLDKSELIPIAAFGVWKAGAAYTPIDPNYPVERVTFTVLDTQATLIVTNRHHAPKVREMFGSLQPAVNVIEIEAALEASHSDEDQNPRLGLGSEQVAYVTYTSGTTGVPKGVAKFHRNVVNSITDLSERYDMLRPGTERVALFAAFVFEPFMRQTLIALINSQTLVVVPDDIRLDPNKFSRFVAEHRITYLNGTGSVLQHFELRDCRSLRKMLLVGEEITAAGLRQLREKFDGQVVNEYSFTETAFVTAIKMFPAGVAERTDRSIGRPLRNVKCYVLTQNLKQVPIGAIGELYIGGRGIAQGYLNRDDLSAERFLINPFQSELDKLRAYNARIYKTGDLARILPNGEIEFLGRSDFQLKLNGVRVEPGEIEARVTEYPGVRQCVVVPREGSGAHGDWRLIGYFVAEPTCQVTESELIEFLEAKLIRVMVPARMVRLERFPVNINGKVDRRLLPDVIFLGSSSTDAACLSATSDGLFGTLREIWSDLLSIPAASIDTDDDFCRLGGQSITCMQLLMRVWQRLRLVVTVEDVFRLKTIGNLAEYLGQQQPNDDADGPAAVLETCYDEPVTLPANGLQQGLLFHAMKSGGGDDAYVMQSIYRYRSAIRPDLMKRAWEYAQHKYPSLRLRFEWRDEAVQIIDPPGRVMDWRFVDLSTVPDAAEQDDYVRALQKRDRDEPYVLGEGPLFRVYQIKQHDEMYTSIFSCHHIILDGWSFPALRDDVHRVYLALLRDQTLETVVDTAYVAAQRYWATHRTDHLSYWTDQIERITDRGNLEGLLNERSRYKIDLNSYDCVLEHRSKMLGIGSKCTAALKSACATNRVTLHSVLQFVWHKTLHVIGGGRTTVVGTIVSGRNLPIDGIENSVGLFINTLPLVVDHDTQVAQTVAIAVAEIQTAVNGMNSRSVIELGQLPTGEMKRRLFNTLLVLENYPRLLTGEEAFEHDEVLRFDWSYDSDKVDYPLALVAREGDDELTVTLWYAGELFDNSAIDTLIDTVQTLFLQIADDMSRPVRELEYVSASVSATFDKWNSTDAPISELTLHGVFEEAVSRWPDAVAVVAGSERVTYRELNARANRIAHHLLRQHQIGPSQLVALMLNKSAGMIASILGVWKAGAGFVPLDPTVPDDRFIYMLEDTGARLVIAANPHMDRALDLAPAGVSVLDLGTLDLSAERDTDPNGGAIQSDLAYAIYTSGTTGRPKAVLVEHRGVVNLHSSMEKLFALDKGNAEEAILSFSNYVFDHFVEQMTDAILSGHTLVLLDDAMRADPPRLYQYINDNRVTYLSGTPSVLSLYNFSGFPSLIRIDAIGEDFTFPVFNKIRESFGGLIINGYGPTEISITSHKRLYGPNELRLNKSIGFPIANTTCYVLDQTMKRVPVGGIGELYIGGIGVARGYLNRDDLTAERFLTNRFQTDADRESGRNFRLYRTGDLVRWLPNGELEYLGRNDQQVKIRGQRIELGDAESVLSAHPEVSRSFVIARDHHEADGASQKYIVAFYLADRTLPESDLKQWMRERLPQVAVPIRIMRLNEVPVNSAGKLDVLQLPATDFTLVNVADYVGPISETEKKLCEVWSQVLPIGTPRFSIRDDFFSLGGDSLRAIRLALTVTDTIGRGLTLADFFKHTTVESQARYLDAAKESDTQPNEPLATGLADAHLGELPVSFAQERLLFIDEFVGGTAAYNVSFVVELPFGRGITLEAIVGALRALVRRHAALRTLLRGDCDGIPLQQILNTDEVDVRFGVPVVSVTDRAELDRLLVAETMYKIRLSEDLPIRVGLFEIAGDSGTIYLSVVVHHTAFDGWSWDVFTRELLAILGGVAEMQLPAQRASYADFAIWQRQRLTGVRLSALNTFWTKTLEGFEPLNLPLDRPRPTQFDYRGREVPFALDAETTTLLQTLAQDAKVSLYSVLLGAYFLLLKMFSSQTDIVVGAPTANRTRPEFDSVIGFFANLLVLRVKVDPELTLFEYVRAVGAVVLQAQVHEELPFEQLLGSLRVPKDPSRHPIVQTVFSLITEAPGAAAMQTYVPNSGGLTAAKFDLSATVIQSPAGLVGNFTYAESLFDAISVDRLVSAFETILRDFSRLSTKAETVRVSAVSGIDELGKVELLIAAIGSVPHPLIYGPQNLHGLFEAAAEQWPDAVAVVSGSDQVTYYDLNSRANQLARHLRVVGVGSSQLVALMFDKGIAMIASILAVWKAGAAYVPLDPSAPDHRIQFILGDSEVSLVLAPGLHAERIQALARLGVNVLDVDRIDITREPDTNLDAGAVAGDTAYAIYTSGTTGRPKAVLVRHETVVSFRNDIVARYFVAYAESRQAVLFLSNYVFDFSIEQFALSILSGNTLIVPPRQLIPDDDFYLYANGHLLTYLSGTPTQLMQFDLSRLAHLRIVLVAGEALQPQHFEKLRREFAGQLLNAYGTTETCVYNTVKRFLPGECHRNTLGTPISNTRVYILDDERLLPAGAVGELCIAGECVSAGYLNRPELTGTQFIRNPFQSEAERRDGRFSRLYRSGDLVRWGPDWTLEFFGRNDQQVKINGLRIEPGEVEAALSSYPGVQQCAVVALASRDWPATKRLVGYYSTATKESVVEKNVLAFLRTKLMPSMVPARLVQINGALPTTVNGKLDTAALPDVDFSTEQEAYVAPRSRFEARLCRIWNELLPMSDVGIDDDFFRCGGDSISALQLTGRLQRELQRKLNVKQVFDFPTVREFVENVLSVPVPDQHSSAELDPLTGDCPLLPIQKWFFAKSLTVRNHWNQYFAIRTPQLDLGRLLEALDRLVDHHDAFRLRFRVSVDGHPMQFYADGSPATVLHTLDINGLSTEAVHTALKDLQGGFDLEHGPLHIVVYLHGFDDGTARVCLGMHHLIVDTVSWRLLTQDLEILYYGGNLGVRGTSYRQWARALQNYTSTQEKGLWEGVARSVAEEALTAALVVVSDPYRERFALNASTTLSLLTESNRAYDTHINDLMLTAVGFALRAVTQRTNHYVTVEGHGREVIDGAPDIRDTIGWFTTMHPVAVQVSDDIGQSIELTKAVRSRTPHNGLGYGALCGTYGSATAPLPQVSFNYLGQFADVQTLSKWRQSSDKPAPWHLDTGLCGSSRATGEVRANDCAIDVTMSCEGGRMIADVESHLGPDATLRFTAELKARLEEIVTHTTIVVSGRNRMAVPDSTVKSLHPDSFDPYVLANEGEAGPILFILPPGEGGAESYLNNIGKQLPGIRLVLFNNVHLLRPMDSFEALARYYISFIKQLQPVGPYSFLGWSFGGVLSLELALQLTRNGETIRNLVFIDSFFNVKKASADIGLSEVDNGIDPINFRYRPNPTDLECCLASRPNVVLFKATKPPSQCLGENQHRIFEYYSQSQFNNLETLFPETSIHVETLLNETHFSWIHNEASVAAIGSRVLTLVGRAS